MNRKYAGQSDAEERRLIISYMARHGWVLYPEVEQYSKYDLKFQKGIDFITLELEHRHEFIQFIDPDGFNDIPYKTIHIPYRKHKSEADYYVIFNRDRTQIFVIRMADIKKSPVIRIKLNRKDSLKEEDFYNVSIIGNRWKTDKL